MKRRRCSSTISRIASILLLTGTPYLGSAENQLKFTHGHHDTSSMTAANETDVASSPRLLFHSPDYFEEESFMGSAAAKTRALNAIKKRRQLQRHLSESKKRKRKRQPKNFDSLNEEYTDTGAERSSKSSKTSKFSKSMSLSVSFQPTISLVPSNSSSEMSAPSQSTSKSSKVSSSSSSSPSQNTMSKAKDKPTMTPTTTLQLDCSRQKSCNSCLKNTNCAHWTAGQCHASCAVTDVSCYTNDGIYTNLSVNEICTKANNESRDRAICSRTEDCSSCIESIKSDGENCMWFEEDGYCDIGCNMSGCGSTNVVTCLFATTSPSTEATTTIPTGSSDEDFSAETSSPTQTSKTLPAVPDAPSSSSISSAENNFLLMCILSATICMASFVL